MFSIKQKVKKIVTEQSNPITAEKAGMLTITGKVCTPAQRLHNFISEINSAIRDKVRYCTFYQMVELPEDLVSKRKEIIEDFKNRGFTIYSTIPENKEIFVISWKYDE